MEGKLRFRAFLPVVMVMAILFCSFSRENFERLLDDTLFRTELENFR